MRAALVALVLLSGCLGSSPADPPEPSTVVGEAVATSVALATDAGRMALQRGGNAIDAAAAIQWTLGVVEPSMSGIGGGSFILYHSATDRRDYLIDGRETAPAASTADQFLTPTGDPQPYENAHRQGYAVGVPGTVRAFEMAVKRWGNASFHDSFDTAIQLATNGFTVTPRFAELVAAKQEKLRSWPASAELFLKDATCLHERVGCIGGTPILEGETFRNPNLASALRQIADQGSSALYQGPMAQAIVDAQAVRNGRMTLADLQGYQPKDREPVRFPWRALEVVGAPPPSSGGLTLGQIVLLLEPYIEGGGTLDDAAFAHLFVEASHLAFADRAAYEADPGFVQVPITGLLHPDYLAKRRALIDAARTTTTVSHGDPWPQNGNGPASPPGNVPAADLGQHTSHFVVVDTWGNIATVTSTIEEAFGTGMVVPGYGFPLNNQLTDFDFQPGGPNQVAPLKRPRTSMTPTLVLRDGHPWLALGSPGGAAIITHVTQTLLRVEAGASLEEAVAAGRLFSPQPVQVQAEARVPPAIRDGLAQRGHTLVSSEPIGIVQAAIVRDGTWCAAADARSSEGGAYAPSCRT